MGGIRNGVDLRVYVAVRREDIEPAVVVHVEEAGSPAHVRMAGLRDSRGRADVREAIVAVVAVKRVRLVHEFGDEDVEPPGVVVIAEIHPHRTEFLTITAKIRTQQKPDLFEGSIMLVSIHVIGAGVVGDV